MPERGGVTRNLAKIVNRRIGAWRGDQPTSPKPPPVRKSEGRSLQESKLAAAISSKLEASNFRATVRLLCSENTPAPSNKDTLKALQSKHPTACTNRHTSFDPFKTNNSRFQALQIPPEDMIKCLRSFPRESSGGPNGITPQHLQDMFSGATDEKLKNAITDFVNILLEGNLPLAARQIIFGGRLIALQKKDGGICPIAIGYTLQRLAAKCANSFVIARRGIELKPIQVGVCVSGGAEAIVHVTRRIVSELLIGHVMVKLDFTNAFSSVRRDAILDRVADKLPELYKFVYASHECDSKLTFGTSTILVR